MPHQGDFSQQFRRRETELLDPYTEDDNNVILTPCGDFTLQAFNGDDFGQKDRALLSPAMFHKFFFPNRQRVNEAIHAIGAKSILHCCGNATELLPELVASGLDAWQSLEPASGIDYAAVKQQFGDKLSFWGPVDNNVLCWGSPADMEAEVKRKIKMLGTNGGYVVGHAHDY